jgi:hypothetical protein
MTLSACAASSASRNRAIAQSAAIDHVELSFSVILSILMEMMVVVTRAVVRVVNSVVIVQPIMWVMLVVGWRLSEGLADRL